MIYKVLNEDGSCCNGGKGKWSLPTQNADGTWIPGKWMPMVKGVLVPCENGYHLCDGKQIMGWLGPAIFEAEYRGERVDDGDKFVVAEARLLRRMNWDARVARQFACDCAERVLPLFEVEYPDDKRPRECIGVVRRFADGKAAEAELDAARAAAWDAARDAAWDAARAAARDAAWATARAAARDYRDAARDARNAAWDAARAAAWDAARDAAWDAAWATERNWQYGRLVEYLAGGEVDNDHERVS